MTPFDEILRRKRRARTPGFAGGELDEQLARDEGVDVLTPANQTTITRPRRATPPMSKEWQRTFDDARATPQLSVPPELAGVAIGEDYDKEQPSLYRIKQGGDGVSITPLDIEQEAGRSIQRPRSPLRRQGSPMFSTKFPTTEVPVPSEAIAEPDLERRRAVSFDPVTGKPNETFYRDKDNIAGLYDAYRNWEPRGAKRGFKNSLKSALLMAAEGVRAAPNDPITGALSGLVVGAGAGTASPNFLNRLRRQQRLPQLAAEVGSELDREKTQAQIDAGRMVEVTLDNGQTVMVPAKTAGTLQSRQQEIDLRGNTLEARKKRWSQLNEHEAARDAQALYNSGAADDSAELRAEIARRLRLPPDIVLPPRGLGNQIKVDELGNYVVISPRSGEVTDTGRGSFSKTQEAGREIRSRRATQAANERTRYIQGQINQRQANRPAGGVRPDTVTGRKAATLIGKIEQRRRTMVRADELLKANPDDAEARAMREKAQAEGEGFAAELNALGAGYEAGPGVLGYPYYKRGGVQQSSGRYAGKRFPAANLPEAAKRLGVSVEEARRILESEGAVIYE